MLQAVGEGVHEMAALLAHWTPEQTERHLIAVTARWTGWRPNCPISSASTAIEDRPQALPTQAL